MSSLDNICPNKQVAKGFLQICSDDTTKLLSSTNNNFEEYSQDLLCFIETILGRENFFYSIIY